MSNFKHRHTSHVTRHSPHVTLGRSGITASHRPQRRRLPAGSTQLRITSASSRKYFSQHIQLTIAVGRRPHVLRRIKEQVQHEPFTFFLSMSCHGQLGLTKAKSRLFDTPQVIPRILPLSISAPIVTRRSGWRMKKQGCEWQWTHRRLLEKRHITSSFQVWGFRDEDCRSWF